MKKRITPKIILFLCIAGILTAFIFMNLMNHNKQVSSSTASELGTLYMSEMMLQVQDHFESIVDIKNKESSHIAGHQALLDISEQREHLLDATRDLEFEYLALYDESGNYETIYGEAAWYRNLNTFISKVKKGMRTATTGYLTTTGDKYIVFGVPIQIKMASGQTSSVLLAGFSVDKLYDYINLDELERNISVDIILTNGSYVLKKNQIQENSFFDYIQNFGSFNGMENEQGIALIEQAMASGNHFSSMVTVNEETRHFYGAPAGEPSDWYFVISMPKGASDEIVESQNTALTDAFLFSGTIIGLMFFGAFLIYLILSNQQMKKTEAARAEAETARSEAETANKAKSTFLSNMSHDIRTPMNAIVAYTTIIEHSLAAGDTEGAQKALVNMKHSSDYLRNLISDVLDMSKIEVGMLNILSEPISLEHFTDKVESISNTYTNAGHLTFDKHVHDILHDSIECDHTRLQQILVNLLSNAIKFTPEGGHVGLEVWQEPSEKGKDYIRTHFIVSDTGIGMSPEFVQTMFDSFTREEHKVRKIEGTGLGLAITKNLVDMMGGTIHAESKEGHGTKFYVTIDFPKAESIAIEAPVSLENVDAKGLRILVAEDNDFNYDIAQYLLTTNGFKPERAEDGQAALEKYCENPSAWNMILMDLRMPILNGYEATEQIRAFEVTLPDQPHIPIYALSADVFAEDIEQCAQAGMDGHIAKPIDMQELLMVLHRHLPDMG